MNIGIRFVLHVSACYNSNKDHNDGKCYRNDHDNWVLSFLNIDHLWRLFNNNSRVCILGLFISLDLNGNVVVSDLLFNLDLDVWVEVVGNTLVVLRIVSVDHCNWLVF